MSQNYKNHARLIPLWHYLTPFIILGILVWGIYNFMDHDRYPHYLGISLIAIAVVLLLIWWYARVFGLKAQDRAIRAEENFRYYLLTGKQLDSRLRMSQIVALRFAPDDEFPILAKRAVDENMSQKAIKQAIKNWKEDHYRV